MSYILDALAKADAERRNGAAAPLGQPLQAASTPTRAGRVWRWLLPAGLLVLGAAAALWWQRGGGARTVPAPMPVATEAAAPPPSVTQPPATSTPATPTEPALATAPRQQPTNPLPILAPAPEPAPSPSARLVPPSTPPSASAPGPTAAPAPGPSLPQADPAPAAALTRAPAHAPTLSISGATYSDNPAHRLLIVNGKVVQEGQEAAPGVMLEVIGPRSAVFNQGGTRFNINHQ